MSSRPPIIIARLLRLEMRVYVCQSANLSGASGIEQGFHFFDFLHGTCTKILAQKIWSGQLCRRVEDLED
jgi:hypothetical protein